MKTGIVRVAAIYVDCPREGCGGGVEGSDGSFVLTDSNLPEGFRVGALYTCFECKTVFKIPAAAARFLGVK